MVSKLCPSKIVTKKQRSSRLTKKTIPATLVSRKKEKQTNKTRLLGCTTQRRGTTLFVTRGMTRLGVMK